MRCVCHEHVINGALKNFPENLTGISLKPFRTILISPGRSVAGTLHDIAGHCLRCLEQQLSIFVPLTRVGASPEFRTGP